jgi:hypothetical protein
MKLTLGQVKQSRIPDFLGFDPQDTRLVQIVNEAHQRLMMQGLFWGTYQTYQICVSSEGCLTWPRQVASIEALAVNDQPITLRNNWFEYLQTGFGIRSTSNSSELQLMDRGRSAVFLDMTDFSSTLQVYSEVDEDASAKLLVQGYDQNGNWIRTLEGSQWIDGEYIAIGTTTAASSKIFTSITGVQKPVTNGPVHLSKVTAESVIVPIGYYQWDEQFPDYRRSIIPGLGNAPQYTCGSGDPLTEKRVVRAVVKLDHIPVKRDTDWFVLGNEPALKNAAKAVQLEEQQNRAEAAQYLGEAIRLLEVELTHYQGRSNVEPMNIQSESWGAGGMPTII